MSSLEPAEFIGDVRSRIGEIGNPADFPENGKRENPANKGAGAARFDPQIPEIAKIYVASLIDLAPESGRGGPDLS